MVNTLGCLISTPIIDSLRMLKVYTRLKKRGVKSINDGQCDTTGLWEGGRGKFVIRFRFLIFKIFSFQDNLKSELRHVVLL